METESESQVDYIRQLIKNKEYESLKILIDKGYIPTNTNIEYALTVSIEIANFLVENTTLEK